MAKTIKFNLICDGKAVRTIEDLKNNFSIEDVLEYYQNGLLKRWLKVRGYESELKMVTDIKETEPIGIVKKLVEIFEVEKEQKKIEEDTYIFEYSKRRAEQLKALEIKETKRDELIIQYHKEYQNLVERIIENKDNMPKIKSCIAEMAQNYFELFKLNHRDLLFNFLESAPKAVFAMLMNCDMRTYYLPSAEKEETSRDKVLLHNKISNLLKDYNTLKEMLGEDLKEFSGATDSYWKDIEPKGKKCMILSMETGNFVREAGDNGGDKSAEEIYNQFLIFDGMDYKSNSRIQKLLYMEV